jgi:hypothetical protein
MDRSGPASGSLPEALATEMDRRNISALTINLSTAGHTMRKISDMMGGEFKRWLTWGDYDGILLSAGGNDFIDAALKPSPGAGILRDMAGKPIPVDGYQCVNREVEDRLIEDINRNFERIYQMIRNDGRNATPIFLNCYDTPTARDAPALRGFSGPWLYEAYRKNHIDPALWPTLTAGLFHDIHDMIVGWCKNRANIYAVPTSGVLKPADAAVSGKGGDWLNEIHPNKRGWRKQAKVWADELLTRIPPR